MPDQTFANTMTLAEFVDQIEDGMRERATVNAKLSATYQDARDAGFNAALLREIVRERALDPAIRDARYRKLDEYRRTLGMYADTPLGEAAMKAASEAYAEYAPAKRRGRPRKILFTPEKPNGIDAP